MRRVFALLGCAIALMAFDAASAQQKANLNKLNGSLRSLKSKQNAARKALSQTKRMVRNVKGDITQIDARLEHLEGALEDTSHRLAKSKDLQAVITADLERATRTLASTKEQVRKRLRWMYMHSEHSVAEILLQSTSLAEFASRGFLLQRIAQADRDLFERFQQEQRQVAAKKRRVDNLVVQVAGLKASQETQQHDLSETREDKAYLLGQLREKQADLERLVRQLDAEENAIQARIQAYYRSLKGKTDLPRFSGRLSRPCGGPITSGFGVRHHPILRRQRMHTGIDMGARSGSPIRAAAAGIVITATYLQGYGNTVIIDHGGQISTLYAHCSRLMVSTGQRVERGQTVAAVGSTGLSTGPHLHFEVRKNGKPVNPMSWL